MTYELDAGSLSNYVTYDSQTHQIVFNCDEMDLLAETTYTYTLTVYMTQFPDCESCRTQVSGVIHLVDPCLKPFVPFSGNLPNVDYSYADPAVFTFPSQLVTPSACLQKAKFTCTYMQDGPYKGGQDLCNFSQGSGASECYGKFNQETGMYTFSCNNPSAFPVGQYTFKIKVII